MIGLLGCGGSGQHATPPKRAITTTNAPEFAVVEARHEVAFAAFGENAGRVERAAITSELHSYYDALAEGHFERGCLLLSREAYARIANTRGADIGASERSCGKQLGEALARTIGEHNERSQFTVSSVKEVRLKGDQGYIVFTTTATGATQRALSVLREGSSWRLTSAIAIPLLYATPAALVR